MLRLKPGDIFAADFRVVGPLSEGGMGALYVVDQLSTGAPRALKLMLPELVADEKLRKRFEQEARIGARIESDHVVQVVAAGLDPATGTPWLAMELLKGTSLAAYLVEHGALPPLELLAVFQQLCHALGAAHSVGVVHRDLKPENIFLTRGRSSGLPFMVKVLDFGIAKIAAEAKTSATAAIGTPAWMAPEQTSRGRPIGPQTDVWALGLIAFWMLTGRSYWKAANDDTSTMGMLLREMLVDELVPASLRAAEFGVCLEPVFDDWFARCVHREVRARFEHASNAYSALVAVVVSGATPANAGLIKEFAAHPTTAPMLAAGGGQRFGPGQTQIAISNKGKNKRDSGSEKTGGEATSVGVALMIVSGLVVAFIGLANFLSRQPTPSDTKGATSTDTVPSAETTGAAAVLAPSVSQRIPPSRHAAQVPSQPIKVKPVASTLPTWARSGGDVLSRTSTLAGELAILEFSPWCKYVVRLGSTAIDVRDCKTQDPSLGSMLDRPEVIKDLGQVKPFDQLILMEDFGAGNACNGTGLWFLGIDADGSYAISDPIGYCGGANPVVTLQGDLVKITRPGGPPNHGTGYLPPENWIYQNGHVRKL